MACVTSTVVSAVTSVTVTSADNTSNATSNTLRTIDIDKLLDQLLQSDKPKLALEGKAVHATMGTKYKSAGAQPVMGLWTSTDFKVRMLIICSQYRCATN